MRGVTKTTKEQWLAIKNCDPDSGETFFYSVRGSKKVCRPSCRKKSYDPKRIIIFDTLDEALARGYTPCTRCHPELERWEGPKKQLASSAEALIQEHYAEKFSLASLAGELHVDKSYLLRTFKEVTGHTPLEYHNSFRCDAAKELLTRPELSVSYIASAVGYVSASHFSQVFRRYAGMTPTQYRNNYLDSLDK